MSKKNCARRVVALATILMLSLAPISLAGDSNDSSSILGAIESVFESIGDAIGDLFGGDTETSDEGEDEGGVPDLNAGVDPVG